MSPKSSSLAIPKLRESNKKLTESSFYIDIKTKFYISFCFAILWLVLSVYISIPWIKDLSEITTPLGAIIIITGVAYIPGYMNAFLVVSLILDKQPRFRDEYPRDNVTLLIAAYNEENGIYDTLKYVANQDYDGNIIIIVIDNNSNDNTSKEVQRAKEELGLNIKILEEKNPGKFNALNLGLKYVYTKYVITLDADTLLHQSAIRYLMARMKSSPKDVCAVAGSVLVKNSRDNILSKVQEWDYFLSISSIDILKN